jgi:hypothetical protein
MRVMADRIQTRAIRRAGELLHEIAPANGANQNIGDGADPKVLTRKDAAEAAGLSERQRKTALRVKARPASPRGPAHARKSPGCPNVAPPRETHRWPSYEASRLCPCRNRHQLQTIWGG